MLKNILRLSDMLGNQALYQAKTMAKAHENIDNLLLVDTLNRIAHSSDMLGNQALYQAKTKGGETRHILQNFSGDADKHNLELMDYLLRDQIKSNPAYSDTLSSEQLPIVKENMARAGNPLMNILRLLMGKG